MGLCMWVPTKEDAVEMFARHYEALHRSGSVFRARDMAVALQTKGDSEGHAIWNAVAETIERLRQMERVPRRREFEAT